MVDEKADQEIKACYEAYTNYASVEVLSRKLADTKMDTLFREIEMPLVFTLFDMEQNGIRVEAEALKQYGNQLAGKIGDLEKEIYEEAGETFNINSPKQLGVVLFENMKLPGGRKTKTGYSTAADVLEKLAPEHPVVAKILEYRQYTKLKSTYADGLANYIQDEFAPHETDFRERIHPKKDFALEDTEFSPQPYYQVIRPSDPARSKLSAPGYLPTID